MTKWYDREWKEETEKCTMDKSGANLATLFTKCDYKASLFYNEEMKDMEENEQVIINVEYFISINFNWIFI